MLELDGGDPGSALAGWADARRNAAWLGWLRRHAPGNALVDLQPGAGVLAVAAARLGARRVVAVADTELADAILALAERNGVKVALARADEPTGDLDVAFAAHGVGPAWKRAPAWVRPGGLVAPARARFFAALVGRGALTDEMAEARAELDRIGGTWGLDLSPVRDALDAAEPYRWFTAGEPMVGPAEEVWDLAPGDAPRPRTLALRSDGPAAGGASGWWEYTLDADAAFESTPPLVCSWADAVSAPSVRVRFASRAGAITARPGR